MAEEGPDGTRWGGWVSEDEDIEWQPLPPLLFSATSSGSGLSDGDAITTLPQSHKESIREDEPPRSFSSATNAADKATIQGWDRGRKGSSVDDEESGGAEELCGKLVDEEPGADVLLHVYDLDLGVSKFVNRVVRGFGIGETSRHDGRDLEVERVSWREGGARRGRQALH